MRSFDKQIRLNDATLRNDASGIVFSTTNPFIFAFNRSKRKQSLISPLLIISATRLRGFLVEPGRGSVRFLVHESSVLLVRLSFNYLKCNHSFIGTHTDTDHRSVSVIESEIFFKDTV